MKITSVCAHCDNTVAGPNGPSGWYRSGIYLLYHNHELARYCGECRPLFRHLRAMRDSYALVPEIPARVDATFHLHKWIERRRPASGECWSWTRRPEALPLHEGEVIALSPRCGPSIYLEVLDPGRLEAHLFRFDISGLQASIDADSRRFPD